MSCHPEGGALHGHHRRRALAGEPRSGPGPGPAPAGPHSAAPAGEPATPSPEPAPFPILKVEDGHGHGRRRWEQERREKGEVSLPYGPHLSVHLIVLFGVHVMEVLTYMKQISKFMDRDENSGQVQGPRRAF